MAQFCLLGLKTKIEKIRGKGSAPGGNLNPRPSYWKSEEFTYQSGANRLHGWNALLERYQKSYSGENWGVLDFTDLEVKVLGSDYAYVLGRWKLAIKDSKKEGVFTIIFRRFPEGWRIIHDHSS
jgi:beta-aspartyl-peptidase (threonine type)